MDASIILGGQQIDVLGAMDRGRAAAENQINLNRQNALAQLYKTQGAGIMAGDPNALAQLAGFDPNAALGVQQNLLGMQATKQTMAFSAEEMQMKRDAAKASASEALKAQADKLTAEQLAQEQKALSDALSGAAFFYQNKDEVGYNAFLQKNGLDPAEYPFQEFPAHAASVEGVLEAMKEFQPPAPAKPQTEAAQLKADLDAGLIDQATYQAEMARRAPKGTSLTVDPATGAVTYSEGVGVGSGAPTSGDALRTSMTDAKSVVDLIDEIAKDPALPGVTGSLEGGGGNNVDEFSGTRRAYYGDAGLSVIQKIAQLQGNAWLGARALLKGGGAITDYESRKAEAAMARLSRAQGDKEFQAALADLKTAITDGMAKLEGAGSGSPQGFDQAEIDALMNGP
jgi:hypothetical protein